MLNLITQYNKSLFPSSSTYHPFISFPSCLKYGFAISDFVINDYLAFMAAMLRSLIEYFVLLASTFCLSYGTYKQFSYENKLLLPFSSINFLSLRDKTIGRGWLQLLWTDFSFFVTFSIYESALLHLSSTLFEPNHSVLNSFLIC